MPPERCGSDPARIRGLATWSTEVLGEEERGAVEPGLLPKLLRMGHFRLFNIVLGRLSQMDVTLIDCIVEETGGRMFAALCRSLNIDKASFVSLFLLSRGARVLADQAFYDRVCPLARRMEI